jgi:twitching motility protein PilT
VSLDRFVTVARDAGASDLHLEGGMPLGLRVRGDLKLSGETIPAATLTALARDLLGDNWNTFAERGSFDLARVVAGVRCRVNVLQSARGIGLAVRLLAPFNATLKKLNLHPSLRKLIERRHGLVLVCGPTGSGKSTTLAALVQEVNLAEARHIVTIESPIEYVMAPRLSLIRQREVGRHTPSVAQALLDAMREDPDVLMVGEMREPETMRLTLNAAETGHLVLATMHSSSCAEALQRLVSAFPAESQASVTAQLADCLVGVVCQRLRFRPDLKMLVPECEVLMASSAMKGVLRQGQLFKLGTVVDGGGQDGSFSFERYQEWLEAKSDWSRDIEQRAVVEAAEPEPVPVEHFKPVASKPQAPLAAKSQPRPKPQPPRKNADGVLEIDDAEDPADILAQLGDDDA